MNLTLSADDQLVQRAREYAVAHETSLNQLIRDYLERLVGDLPREEAAKEFGAIATASPGNSHGQITRREEIYRDRIDGIAHAAESHSSIDGRNEP